MSWQAVRGEQRCDMLTDLPNRAGKHWLSNKVWAENCPRTIISHRLLLPVAAGNQRPVSQNLIQMKGWLLNDTQVYVPVRFSLPVLLYLLHPFTGRVPVPSHSLSCNPLDFGVGNRQPRHGSNTVAHMPVKTAAEQLVEQHTPSKSVVSSVTWKACETGLTGRLVLFR